MNPEEKDLPLKVLPLKKAFLVLRAGDHPLRQRILQMIHQHERLPVSGIITRLRLEPSIASQHLAVLRRAGFVCTKRKGRQIFYSVNYQRLHEVAQFVGALLC